MAISKEKLIAELDTPIEGDSVASFLRDGEGTKLTSTLNSGKQALDVFITNPLEVDVGLDAADDSVAAWLKDGSGNALSSTSGALHVRIDSQAAAVSVSATDLDIRDLAFATDSVDVSGSSVSISGSVAVTATDFDIRDLSSATDSIAAVQSGAWSVTASATDFDIRDLQFATDSVDVSGSSVSISGSVAVTATDLDIRDLSAAQDEVDARFEASSIASSAPSITTTAAALVASALSGRRRMLIQNLGTQAIFVGGASVTSSNGIRIPAGANVELELGAAVSLYGVTSAGTADVRILEMA